MHYPYASPQDSLSCKRVTDKYISKHKVENRFLIQNKNGMKGKEKSIASSHGKKKELPLSHKSYYNSTDQLLQLIAVSITGMEKA